MSYFLDTNICIYFLKGTHPKLKNSLQKKKPKNIKIPSIVKAELFFGAEKSNDTKKNIEKVEKFLQPYEIVPFDSKASEVYAKIRVHLEKVGNIIGANDLIIASTVLCHKGTLVTNNQREFKSVKKLELENWI